MGGQDAIVSGNPKLVGNFIGIYGGNRNDNISLGKGAIPTDGSPITIEIWGRQDKLEWWPPIIAFGQYCGHHAHFTWSQGTTIDAQRVLVCGGGVEVYNKILAPFTLGEEFHIAFVFSYSKEEWLLECYKQDVQSGRTISKVSFNMGKGWSFRDYPMESCHLGMGYCNPNEKSASASYNEVRIWKRALSEEELTQNAIKFHNAGETMKK